MTIELAENQSNPHAAVNRIAIGELEVDVAGSGTTVLTDTQAQYNCLVFSGALTGNSIVEVPAENKGWWIENDTSGTYTLTIKPNAGTGIAVTQGKRVYLRYSTYSTDVVAFTSEL